VGDLRGPTPNRSADAGDRLWHQLTVTVQDFLRLPASEPLQADLHSQFISTFAQHLNQVKRVQIAAHVAQQIPGKPR
jgi:26S proteasome regulatory subunit N9